jgi:hypothetical protein
MTGRRLLLPVLHRSRIHSFSSSSTGGSSGGGGGDSVRSGPPETPWQRGAVQVKNTDLRNPYLDAIRRTHDPIQHIRTVEEELKGTIGRALGKQGDKILLAVQCMEEQWHEYERLLSLRLEHHQGRGVTATGSTSNSSTMTMLQDRNEDELLLHETVRRYNHYRDQALTARWELTVHRQAAGCIVGNHQYVMQAYPIGAELDVTTTAGHPQQPAISGTSNNSDATTAAAAVVQPPVPPPPQQKKKRFTDQLEWWQTIGRWK